MNRLPLHAAPALVGLVMSVLSYSALAQPSCTVMQDLGTLGGSYSAATAVSADGSVVVGVADNAAGWNRAFRWTAAGGMQDLGTFGGVSSHQATAVSADGSVVVGWARNAADWSRAFRWTAASGLQDLGTLGGNSSSAYALSADGSVVVGSADNAAGWNRAFRWTAAGGMQDLGTFGGNSSSANAVTADGSVVVGYAGNAAGGSGAFRWTAPGGMQDLGTFGGNSSSAIAVSADGSVVVGYAYTAAAGRFHAFRWTAAGGMQDLGTLGGNDSAASAVSADGSVVVGYAYNAAGWNRAFLWTAAGGMQDLGTFGGDYSKAYAVTADGSVVVGYAGNAAGGSGAFRWTAAGGMQDLGTLGGNYSLAYALSADGSVVVGYAANVDGAHAFRWGGDTDTDGDGLLDDWECNGIPYTDASGQPARYILDSDGDGVSDANWQHKDLFVEVDAMSGFSLDAAAIPLLKAAFGTAPISNPDGSTGITLHVVRDEANLAHVALWATEQPENCWPTTFDAVRTSHFGTPAERAGPNAAPALTAKSKAYRYCVVADRATPDNIGGCGQTPGDNFVIFLGSSTYDTEAQAALFMHELGHNLGLDHGGGDDHNGKPNYPSVMNYTLSYRADWNTSFWRLDFSRAGAPVFPILDESSLDENAGIGTPGGFYQDFKMPFGVNEMVEGVPVRSIRYVQLDGSPVDYGDVAGTGFLDHVHTAGVTQDLNYAVDAPPNVSLPSEPTPSQTLHPFDDWSNVRLPLAATLGASAPTPTYPDDELTGEAREWIDKHFPPPPPSCPADWDGNGTVNSTDVSDFINQWFQDQADGTFITDWDANGVVNSTDVSHFINTWFEDIASGCG